MSLRNGVLPSRTMAVWSLAAVLLLAAGNLPLQAQDQASTTYYFPHLAVGAGWQTTITYINYSSEEVTCQTDFLSDDGNPLMVSFADRGTVVSRPDVLPPGGSVHQETNVELSAPLSPGWARATCSGPVKASLLFRQHDSAGMPVAEAGVNAATVPATRFVTFAEQGEGKNGTGVAYANPSDTAAMLTFTAKDADGEILASVDRPLLPDGHAAENMVDLFGLSSFTGSLEVTSTEPIVSLSLNFEAAPVFSSLPPGELDAAAQGSTTYYFPHLAVGAGWQTTITYINYSPQEVNCTTEFLSDQGSPLMVSFADRGTVVSWPDTLDPGGSVHQETNMELSAPLAPGWARATCSGPVKASLLFRQHDSAGMPVAEAGVNAATVPATRFVTFAEQGEGKNGTGVAYANPSDTAAMLTFTAKDEAGQTLDSSVRTLLPGGHDAQNMVDLFGLSSFTGSLEVTSTAPIASLSLNFEAAPVFSSLPSGEVDAADIPGVIPMTGAPDLVVQTPSVSDSSPNAGESFTLSATVRNQGNDQSASTTLRYYHSPDATISMGDTEVGTDAVGSLAAGETSSSVLTLTAPSTAGTYYYGACVDPVSGDSNAGNNCSNSRAVEVRSASMAGIIPDANLRAAIEAALDKVSGAPITMAEMKTLDRLVAADHGISDLTGLESAANLTSLDLGGNTITDLSPLSGLTNLRYLTLWVNNLTDVSALSGLTTLRDLRLGGNTISDVSALSGLTNLTYLHLNGNTITDLSPLSGLTELEGLELYSNSISDISALSGLTNLQNLGLGHNNLTDFSVLSGLTNLTSLSLDNTAISDLSVLSSLTNLDFLSLWDNNLTDVSALSGLTNLASLRLVANNLTDVSALSGLTNLELLYLGNNNLTDVSALSGLTTLTELSLWDNNLTDVSALSGLTNLRSLELANNNLTDVSALRNLANLASLDLRGNPLNVSSVNDHIPALERSGATVHFDRLLTEGDFDIELVFLDDHFTEKHKQIIRYAARRWMSIIREDLPDHTFANRWSGGCGDQSYAIPSGERIDDLRIYVIARHLVGGIAGQGGPSVLRTTGLPVIGCVEFGLESVTSESVSSLESRNLALHEMGHVLGIGTIWDDFIQNPTGDPHFTGPLAIAAFNAAGGRDYAGAKVPVERAVLGHWRAPVLEGELMVSDGSGALSAITVQSLADLGYGVDVTQADSYTLRVAVGAQASAKHSAAIPEDDRLRGSLAFPTHAEPKLWCGLDGEREPIYVVDQLGRIIRTIGN